MTTKTYTYSYERAILSNSQNRLQLKIQYYRERKKKKKQTQQQSKKKKKNILSVYQCFLNIDILYILQYSLFIESHSLSYFNLKILKKKIFSWTTWSVLIHMRVMWLYEKVKHTHTRLEFKKNKNNKPNKSHSVNERESKRSIWKKINCFSLL